MSYKVPSKEAIPLWACKRCRGSQVIIGGDFMVKACPSCKGTGRADARKDRGRCYLPRPDSAPALQPPPGDLSQC
jgi:hypothetical protein